MSIIYCEKHDQRWDSDKLEECPSCESSDSECCGQMALYHGCEGCPRRQHSLVHTDHPARHWDRTCPACVAEGQITAAGIPVEVKNNSGSSAKVDSCKEKLQPSATPRADALYRVCGKCGMGFVLEEDAERLEQELAQACLERNAARNVLARAIERERLANMRATEWEEAAEAARSATGRSALSEIAEAAPDEKNVEAWQLVNTARRAIGLPQMIVNPPKGWTP